MPKNPVKAKAERLKKVTEKFVEDIVLAVMKENQDYAIELNWDQLNRGKDRQNRNLRAYKSKAYAAKKRKQNPAGVTDLKLTGDFWAAFRLVTEDGFPVSITSDDEKTEQLVEKYRETIFGLNQTNVAKFARYIQPEIKRRIHSLLQL